MATASKTAKLVITSIVISIIVLAAFTLIFIRFIVPAYQITEDQIYSVLTKLFPVLIGLILIQIGVMAAKKGEPEYKDTIDKLSPNAYDSALYTEPKDDPMLRGKVSPEVFGNASRADAQHAEAVREIIREVPVEVEKEVIKEVAGAVAEPRYLNLEDTINAEIESANTYGYDLTVVAIKARENLTSMGIEEFFGEDTLAFDGDGGNIFVVLPMYNEIEAKFALRKFEPLSVVQYKDGDAEKLLSALKKGLK